MPTHSRAVEVKFVVAAVLVVLFCFCFVFGFVFFFVLVVRKAASEGEDSIFVEGLVTASLIRYFRCFATGVRLELVRSDLEGLDEELLKQHDYYKHLRDKFVAHSINPFEENWVTATASERDGVAQPITALGHGSHRIVLSVGESRGLSALIKQVRYIVGAKIKAEEQRLLAIIQALPPEVIHGSDLRSPKPLSTRDVERTRRQTRL